MRLEYIEPFVTATVNVLSSVFRCEISQGDIALLRGSQLTGDVTVLIGLRDRSGEGVILNMDARTADNVCTALNGTSCGASDGLGLDTIGELANMIAGNAVTALSDEGYDFSVQPPVPVTHEDLAQLTEGLELFQVPVTSEYGLITVNFTVRTA